MYLLWINTCDDVSQIALVADGEIVNQKSWQAGRNLGSELLPSIANLLNKSSIALNNVDVIAVNSGPGSFTGTRIGVVVANTLGFSLDVPVVPAADLNSAVKIKINTKEFSGGVNPIYASSPSVTIKKQSYSSS